ncbi:MAG: hypothetical protein ACREVA_04160 [Burkholderiales bacterium]
MARFRESVEKHPVPWFMGSLLAAFLAGIGAYQTVISWAGFKVVRNEADLRGTVRVEATPSDSRVDMVSQGGKFVQGMTLAEGVTELEVSKSGYKSYRIRLSKNGANITFAAPLERIPTLRLFGAKKYGNEPTLSLAFNEVEVETAIKVLFDNVWQQRQKAHPKTNAMNIVFAQQFHQKINLRLQDVPGEQALDVALAMAGLEMKQSGNVFLVDYASDGS